MDQERIAEAIEAAEAATAEIVDGEPVPALLAGRAAERRFVLAGRAIVTLVSPRSGQRFTYRIAEPSDERRAARDGERTCWKCRGSGRFGARGRCFACAGRGQIAADEEGRRILFVGLLTGPENSSDYTYLGQITGPDGASPRYAHGARSRIAADAPGARAIGWWLARVLAGGDTEGVQAWHAGRCGRCARVLTVPSSIASGFGPECAARMLGE